MEKDPFRVPPGVGLRAHRSQTVVVVGGCEDVVIVGDFGWVVW